MGMGNSLIHHTGQNKSGVLFLPGLFNSFKLYTANICHFNRNLKVHRFLIAVSETRRVVAYQRDAAGKEIPLEGVELS